MLFFHGYLNFPSLSQSHDFNWLFFFSVFLATFVYLNSPQAFQKHLRLILLSFFSRWLLFVYLLIAVFIYLLVCFMLLRTWCGHWTGRLDPSSLFLLVSLFPPNPVIYRSNQLYLWLRSCFLIHFMNCHFFCFCFLPLSHYSWFYSSALFSIPYTSLVWTVHRHCHYTITQNLCPDDRCLHIFCGGCSYSTLSIIHLFHMNQQGSKKKK